MLHYQFVKCHTVTVSVSALPVLVCNNYMHQQNCLVSTEYQWNKSITSTVNAYETKSWDTNKNKYMYKKSSKKSQEKININNYL